MRACFAEHVELDFARSGHVSTMSIAMDEGPIEGQPFSNYEVLKQVSDELQGVATRFAFAAAKPRRFAVHNRCLFLNVCRCANNGVSG